MRDIDELKVNLQLFADDDDEEQEDDWEDDTEEDDEEDDNEDLDNDDEDSDDDDSDSDVEDEEEKEDDSEKSKGKGDKKTHAIVNLKRKLKETEEQLKKALEQKEKAEPTQTDTKDLNEFYDKEVKGLVEDGVTEELAKRQIQLERDITMDKFDKLAEKYPNIKKFMKDIVRISRASGGELSYEDVYRAKFSKEDEYSLKVRAEQNALLNKKNADSKKLETSAGSKTNDVKLTQKENEMYKKLRKGTFPNLSVKRFKKMLEED